jgi:YaiO family outer membrane protein
MPAAAQGPHPAAELRLVAERLREERRLPEALEAYRALVAADSAFEHRFWLAKLEAWTGDYGRAERDFLALLAERPDDGDARTALADVRRWRAGGRSARLEADIQYLGERLSGGTAGNGAMLSLRSLPPRVVEWRAALLVQDKFGRTESRGGGELGIRVSRSVQVRGSAFLSPGAEVLPRGSWSAGIGGTVARGVVVGAEYALDDYSDARVHGPALLAELYVGRGLAAARYRYASTRFDVAGADVGEHGGLVSAGYTYGAENLVRLFAGAGGEAFSQPSRDRIGRFTAHTVGAAWRHWVTPALGLEAVYARQDRSDGGRRHSYGLRVVRRW